RRRHTSLSRDWSSDVCSSDLGEHHRLDYAVSAPPVVLSAISQRTKHIKLTSTTTVLSTVDPVRLYEDFATLDLLSNGRAEILAEIGRASCREREEVAAGVGSL